MHQYPLFWEDQDRQYLRVWLTQTCFIFRYPPLIETSIRVQTQNKKMEHGSIISHQIWLALRAPIWGDRCQDPSHQENPKLEPPEGTTSEPELSPKMVAAEQVFLERDLPGLSLLVLPSILWSSLTSACRRREQERRVNMAGEKDLVSLSERASVHSSARVS